MGVEEQKLEAKKEKETLKKMILTYQSNCNYTAETLEGKTLKQLKEVYDKVMHKG